MANWIEEEADGSGAVGQVEGEPGYDCRAKFLRLIATCLNVGYLNIDDSIGRAYLALGNTKRPDCPAPRENLHRLIRSLQRRKAPVE